MRILIPSHRRAALFEKKTFAWLRGTNVPLSSVTVVVSDAEDQAAYAHLPVRVVVPPRTPTGLTDKFNAIHYAYAPGARVVVLEDDVTVITGANNKSTVVTDALAMFEQGFQAVGPGGLWGVVPHSNTFFFPGGVSTSLKLIVAHVFGFVSTHLPQLAVTAPSKTDYERTCRYYTEYGRVVRLDAYGVKTNSYTQAGGLQAEQTRTTRTVAEAAAVEQLTTQWPHMLQANTRKKSLFAEMSFARSLPVQDVEGLKAYRAALDRQLGPPPTPLGWPEGWLE